MVNVVVLLYIQRSWKPNSHRRTRGCLVRVQMCKDAIKCPPPNCHLQFMLTWYVVLGARCKALRILLAGSISVKLARILSAYSLCVLTIMRSSNQYTSLVKFVREDKIPSYSLY